MDISLQSEIAASLELGLYYPAFSSKSIISFSIGLKGILGSGTIGMKLSISLKDIAIKIEFYYEFKAFQLYAYILFKIEFKLGITFSLKFYLYNEKICECKECKTNGTEIMFYLPLGYIISLFNKKYL